MRSLVAGAGDVTEELLKELIKELEKSLEKSSDLFVFF